jgi:hypothetical protein
MPLVTTNVRTTTLHACRAVMCDSGTNSEEARRVEASGEDERGRAHPGVWACRAAGSGGGGARTSAACRRRTAGCPRRGDAAATPPCGAWAPDGCAPRLPPGRSAARRRTGTPPLLRRLAPRPAGSRPPKRGGSGPTARQEAAAWKCGERLDPAAAAHAACVERCGNRTYIAHVIPTASRPRRARRRLKMAASRTLR